MKWAIVVLSGHNRHQLVQASSMGRACHEMGVSLACVVPEDLLPEGVTVAGVDHVERYAGESGLLSYGDGGASEVYECVRKVSARGPIQALFPLSEDHVWVGARCRRDFGIPGMLPEHAIYFRDKTAMAARAAELGATVQPWCVPYTLETVRRFVSEHGFPIIVKPADRVGGLGVSKVVDDQELEGVWARVRDDRMNVRVEKFSAASGQRHVDVILANGKRVFGACSDYLQPLLNYRPERRLGSFFQADTSGPVEQQMIEQVTTVALGFGMRDGITHTEFFFDGKTQSFTFGEMAARPLGVYGVQYFDAIFGIDVAYEWARTTLDPSHEIVPRKKVFAIAELFPAPAGKIRKVPDLRALQDSPGVVDAAVIRSPGDELAAPRHIYDNLLGSLITVGDSSAEVTRRHEAAVRRFEYSIEAL